MKKIYSALLIAATLMPAMTSCDDFLDVRPKGEKVEDDLFKDPAGFEDAIYGVYGSMADPTLYGCDFLWGITDVMAQDLDCGSVEMNALAQYKYDDNENLRLRFVKMWTNAYKSIGYANNVIQNLDKKSPDELPLYNSYRGEMLGVRALLHFDLLRFFAPTEPEKQGIPYVETFNFSVKPFLTVGEVRNKIIADLTEAEKLLTADENLMSYPRANGEYLKFNNWRETHMNIYAVRALLARVYWYFGDMANAAKYARMVIDSGNFPLVNVTEIQDYISGVLSPKETIFGIYSVKYLDTCNKYLYKVQSYMSYTAYDNTSLNPRKNVYDKDTDPTVQDYRRNHFRYENSLNKYLKVVDYQAIENGGVSPREGLISGMNIMRVSELYLIAAEALLESDYNAAVGYFNEEIKSRGLRPLSADETLTTDRIFNEYHKELFGEGQVWFNMKRCNVDIISNAENRTIPASSEIYVVPVPKEEFEYRP